MPVTKTVLKKVRQQASVKLIGDGQANITTFDLKLADETLDNGNIAMNITGMVWSTSGATPIVITRNGNVTQYLSGNDNWSLTQMFGISDTVANSANISIAMPANSLMYLTITKAGGVIEPHQQLAPW